LLPSTVLPGGHSDQIAYFCNISGVFVMLLLPTCG